AAIAEALPTLLAGTDWQTILDGGTRSVLERQALAPFLQRQRWFAARSGDLRQARFTDWTMLRAGSHPAFLTVASVEYGDGWTDSYFAPLSMISDDSAARVVRDAPGRVLARVTGARKGAIVDGFNDDDLCDRLVALVVEAREAATKRGTVHGTPTRPPAARIEVHGERKWTRAVADQSNSIAFLNDQYALKLF